MKAAIHDLKSRTGIRRWFPDWFAGEFAGTFLYVFFGCGSICASVTLGAQVGVFQVAIIWGFALTSALILATPLNQAQLNPAVTLGLAWAKLWPWKRVGPCFLAQWLGAFAAVALLFFLFGDAIRLFELRKGILRGHPGSEVSAMVFCQYFPSPNGVPLHRLTNSPISPLRAFAIELVGTALLALVYLGARETSEPRRTALLRPALMGIAMTMLVSLFAPLTMAGFNPARDLGPRIFSSLAGWGAVPFNVNGLGTLTVYTLAPLLGGLLGGILYRVVVRPFAQSPPA